MAQEFSRSVHLTAHNYKSLEQENKEYYCQKTIHAAYDGSRSKNQTAPEGGKTQILSE